MNEPIKSLRLTRFKGEPLENRGQIKGESGDIALAREKRREVLVVKPHICSFGRSGARAGVPRFFGSKPSFRAVIYFFFTFVDTLSTVVFAPKLLQNREWELTNSVFSVEF